MVFPQQRLRRLRKNRAIAGLIRENTFSPGQLIAPLFVAEGKRIKKEISSMPGQFQLSEDTLVNEAEQLFRLGIPGVILFGIPKQKDAKGSQAYHAHGVVQKAIRTLKKELPELLVFSDVCLCEYTDHGHCGLVHRDKNGRVEIENDTSLELLAKMALSHAEAGVDWVAPSDMMDGRVGAIRAALDNHGFEQVGILSYAAKYASAFYGPFREAANSTPAFGDRRSYQMDPANALEALREIELDLQEGADIVMVKPALAYLDIIHRAKERFAVPVAAYQVSGEYSMVKAAAAKGWIDEAKVRNEILLSIRRAGADFILTYFAKDFAKDVKG